MGDIKLFRFSKEDSSEIMPTPAQIERSLQLLIEKHMECFLGIKLLAHEYRTGRSHRGYIDSLGLDENNCPVILEYKRFNDENVICQGLYYLDWLLDHRGQFVLLTKEKLGDAAPDHIEFGASRVLCIASAFSRYDEQAIMQIDRNIELIRYKFFGSDLLLLEMLNTSLSVFSSGTANDAQQKQIGAIGMPAPFQEKIRSMTDETENLYLELLSFAENLGEDVNIKFLKHYLALARLKNFACIQPLRASLKVWLCLDPGSIPLEEGFSRDVSMLGHLGSGDLELEIKDQESLQKAMPLIELSYQQN